MPGLESAGREGGLRYLEDLTRWGADEPDHVLYAGDLDSSSGLGLLALGLAFVLFVGGALALHRRRVS